MADTQTRYAKQLDNGTFRYYYGNGAIPTKTGFIVKPKHEQLVVNGYYRVRDNWTPTDPAPEGKEWIRTGRLAFVEATPLADSYFHPEYIQRDIPPPPPRTFSKLKVVAALKAANVWDSVKQYIIDADLYDLFLAAQDFAEDNKYFTQGKAALQTALGWTDEQVEAVLAASVI